MSNSLYANSEERKRLIAGLREIAAFLDDTPEAPAPRTITVNVFPPTGMTDAEAHTEIDLIAALIGAAISESRGGHYVASLRFGPVEYCAVSIPRDNKEGVTR